MIFLGDVKNSLQICLIKKTEQMKLNNYNMCSMMTDNPAELLL